MKKYFLPLIVFCLYQFQNSFAARWTELNAVAYNQPQSEVPHSRVNPLIFSYNNEIFYGGGIWDEVLFDQFTDYYKYDVLNDHWTLNSLTPFQMQGDSKTQTFTINNKAYYCDEVNNTWEFDMLANQWTQKMNYPGGPRTNFTCFSGNGKGYLTLGKDNNATFLFSLYEFDPALNTWTAKSNFPGAGRGYAKVVSFPGGGFINGGNTNQTDSWYYDAANDNWISKSQLNDTLNPFTTFSFVVGGKGYFVCDSTVWQYDLSSNSWALKNPALELYYHQCTGIAAGNFAYAIDGEYMCRYDPLSDQWTPLHKPEIPSFVCVQHGDAAYFDGWKYDLLANSWTRDSILNGSWMFSLGTKIYGIHNNSFSEFDPSTYAWSSAAVMPSSVVNISFTLAGKGYYVSDSSLYQYDQALNQWTAKANYPGHLIEHGVVFTNNDSAYYGLGYSYNGGSLHEFWKYNSLTDSWIRVADGPAFGAMYYTSIGTKGYCGGGDHDSGQMLNEDGLFQFDMVTETWSNISAGCSIAGPGERFYCFCFNYQNNIYTGGGYDAYTHHFSPSHFDLWKYDPNTLLITNNLPSHLCQGENYALTYSASSVFNPGNEIRVELSNLAGYFSGMSFLQTYSTTDSTGTLMFSIPHGNYTGGKYKIRITSTLPSDCMATIDSFYISHASVHNFIGQVINIIPGQQMTYNVTYYDSVNYQWNITNGNLISGQGTNNVVVEWYNVPTGSIEIIATDGGCSDTLLMPVNILPAAVNQINYDFLKIYPNPFRDFTIIDFNENISDGVLRLYDLTGRLVYFSNVEGKNFVLKRNDLIEGVYFFEVKFGEKEMFGKVVVGD